MAHPERVKELAIKMRSAGASYTDIMSKLELSKSTVKYMVRAIRLTEPQKAQLAARRPAHSLSEDGRDRLRAAASKNSRKGWKDNRAKRLVSSLRNIRLASLAYREDEMPIKAALEGLYGCAFQKEAIGNRVLDFANDELLIEHSCDGTKGLSDIISRFKDIQVDPRRQIAFVNTGRLGTTRLTPLKA